MDFDRRVNESEVARILQLISQCPHHRLKPQSGDIPGNFDYWFDGGACRVNTGWAEFMLENDIRANVATPIPSLSITIDFPDGRRVEIRQTKL